MSTRTRSNVSNTLALSLILAGACGGTASKVAAPEAAANPAAPPPSGLKIALATVYVDDQEKALHFYTDVLGFVEKDDFTNGSYRWLTVTSPADPEGTELLLALDSDPAANALQEAMFQRGQPAIMFYTDDVQADYERIKARGAELTMPPTVVNADSKITMVKDTCGNLIQLTQLAR